MTFTEFFIYSTITNGIYFTLYIGYLYFRAIYLQNKITKLLQSGEIKVLNLDDLEDELYSKDKKTWN